MTYETFDKIVLDSFDKIKTLLSCKGREYASEKDRLHNFKELSLLQKNIPEKTLLNLVSKHIVALFDKVDFLNSSEYVTRLTNGNKNFNIKLKDEDLNKYDEYIFDIVVYMILLRGLLNERIIIKKEKICLKKKK